MGKGWLLRQPRVETADRLLAPTDVYLWRDRPRSAGGGRRGCRALSLSCRPEGPGTFSCLCSGRRLYRAAFESETGESANILPRAGAFSEFFVSHACVCIAVPTYPPPTCPSFDPRWYLAAQPLGTLIHAVKKLGSIMGINVAIVGQGGNGLIMTGLIERLGARRIIAMDILEDRLQLSKKSGATHTILSSTDPRKKDNMKKTIHDITEGEMCDIAVDCVGHNEYSMDLAAAMTKDAGTVLLFGLPPAQDETGFTIRSPDFRRNIRYQTTHSPDMKTFELAVDFLKLGRFDPSLLFTHYIPFTKFPEAYDMASNYKDGVVKIILTFD